MPKPHQGALSGEDYTIPDLDDTRDIEQAFSDFADSLPKTPAHVAIIRVSKTHAKA